MRIAVVWNVPVACNRASADFIITSPLMNEEYERFVPDYDAIAAETGLYVEAATNAQSYQHSE